MLSGDRDLEALRTQLTEWLRAQLAADALSITALKKPSAGLSNETFIVDASWRAGGLRQAQSFVLRVQPSAFQVFPEYDLSKQYRIMQALAATDVPVPRVRWFEPDVAVLGSPFYLMEKIDGDIPSEVPPYHAYGHCFDATPARRAAIWWSGIDMLARVHRLEWRRLDLSCVGGAADGVSAISAQLEYYARYLDWVGGEQPILRAALAWLRAHAFAPRRVTLCWGDSRLPNLIFRDDRVIAVLDWEMAFIGDPEADLGWWLFLDSANSEGYGIPRLPGFPDAAETIARYEAVSGHRVEHAFYHQVLAAFRFGVIMARIAGRMRELGWPTPTADFERDNVCTQELAAMLELPPPGGGQRAVTRIDAVVTRIQFHLRGAGGSDWYVVCDRGAATRHAGTTPAPDVTVTASAVDWDAIQRGELDRIQAYMGGKLQIEGDTTLLMQMEETITKLSRR